MAYFAQRVWVCAGQRPLRLHSSSFMCAKRRLVARREFTSNCNSQRTIRCSAKVKDLNQFARGRHLFLSCSPRGSANSERPCVDGTESRPPALALPFGNFSAACAEFWMAIEERTSGRIDDGNLFQDCSCYVGCGAELLAASGAGWRARSAACATPRRARRIRVTARRNGIRRARRPLGP